MNDEYRDIPKICRAPNDKFYVLWRGQPVCTPNDALRYFETEHEAQLVLAEIEDPASRETANLSSPDASLTMGA
jgi:hypothetical protein